MGWSRPRGGDWIELPAPAARWASQIATDGQRCGVAITAKSHPAARNVPHAGEVLDKGRGGMAVAEPACLVVPLPEFHLILQLHIILPLPVGKAHAKNFPYSPSE